MQVYMHAFKKNVHEYSLFLQYSSNLTLWVHGAKTIAGNKYGANCTGVHNR